MSISGFYYMNMFYCSYQRFHMQTGKKGQFCFVLTHSSCLYAFLNKRVPYLTTESTVITAMITIASRRMLLATE